MILLIVHVAPDAEGVIIALPASGGWALREEEYQEDGSGVLVIEAHEWDMPAEVPYAVELALDSHPGVVSYRFEEVTAAGVGGARGGPAG